MVFAVLAIAELRWPVRSAPFDDRRLMVNFSLGIGNLAMTSLLPITGTIAAIWANGQGIGLFQLIPIHWLAALLPLLLAKSLLNYWVHRLFHRVDWLWPLHAVHHRDNQIDQSTGLRSHPLAFLINGGANMVLTVALGPPVIAVILVDSFLFASAFWQHANLRLPDALSARLERWLVTPRMHLVHHARDRALHDSNYGEILSIWDHLFGTYQAPPAQEFAIGVTTANLDDLPKH